MTTEAQKRATTKRRDKMRRGGMRHVSAWLLPQEVEVLLAYVERRGCSQNMAIQDAVLRLRDAD